MKFSSGSTIEFDENLSAENSEDPIAEDTWIFDSFIDNIGDDTKDVYVETHSVHHTDDTDSSMNCFFDDVVVSFGF